MNEEEKKAIEKFVKKCKKFDESVEIKGVSVGEEYRILETVCKALDLVEKLQKENEELKADNYELNNRITDLLENIPVQKVKDKIEELEEELEIMKVDNMYGRYKEYGGKTKWERLFATKYGMHDALQELIEEREEN